MSKVVIVSGSPSKTSRLTSVIQYAKEALTAKGMQIEWLSVSDLPAEDLIQARFDSPEIVRANALVESADAIIIASPVYKASYTGVLKTYLDLLPQKALADKLILPIFIGGSIAHLLSIDYSLKPVLSALAARYILGGVYIVDYEVTRNEQGSVDFVPEVQKRLDASLQQFYEETAWYSQRGQCSTVTG
ncbi:NADPH-dependent FMN reductase [Paenibacillus sp. J2TS4]|uniref:NADPH-dependent FMN reductase n=1 Tax=Paenibacillus sp. J2TS4 TaxID=2807194 RepID=UPI001B11B819|nr:NADPH-dependent FMN reductase [Paenibacillus sp. J2TS4]GIP31109.1 FMN reductase (NADPH) [Paenibacillus sp. J2TS4]